MSKITLDLIQKLRERTGVGMMDCRKALDEAGGDVEEAVTILRKKGLSVAAKRAENPTENGIVDGCLKDDFVSLVEISCETDFSARTDAMKNFAKTIANVAASEIDSSSTEKLFDVIAPGSNLTVKLLLDELISKICESIKIAKTKTFKLEKNSVAGMYIHPDNSVAAIVELVADKDLSESEKQELAPLCKEICMQIAVNNPLAINSSEVDQNLVQKEIDTCKAQLSQTKKPESMWDMIVEGKLKKYYEDVCLLNQKFIKDDSVTVAQKIDAAAKKLGVNLTLKRFARIGINR